MFSDFLKSQDGQFYMKPSRGFYAGKYRYRNKPFKIVASRDSFSKYFRNRYRKWSQSRPRHFPFIREFHSRFN